MAIEHILIPMSPSIHWSGRWRYHRGCPSQSNIHWATVGCRNRSSCCSTTICTSPKVIDSPVCGGIARRLTGPTRDPRCILVLLDTQEFIPYLMSDLSLQIYAWIHIQCLECGPSIRFEMTKILDTCKKSILKVEPRLFLLFLWKAYTVATHVSVLVWTIRVNISSDEPPARLSVFPHHPGCLQVMCSSSQRMTVRATYTWWWHVLYCSTVDSIL